MMVSLANMSEGDKVSLVSFDEIDQSVATPNDDVQLGRYSLPVLDDIAEAVYTVGTTFVANLSALMHRNKLAITRMGLLGRGYRPDDVTVAGLPARNWCKLKAS